MNQALFIPIELLEEFSNQNYGKLNRSIDVELLKDKHPNISGVLSPYHLDHYQAFGEDVEEHYRLLIDSVLVDETIVPMSLSQDITKEQMKVLLEVKQAIMDMGE